MKKMLTMLLTLALMLTALAVPAMATGEDLVGGDLLVGVVGTPYATNGWTSNDLNANLIADILYPQLVKFDDDAIKQPYILESYESNEDMTVWTAKIHDGMYWHDGEKFTAEDLAFTANYCATHVVNFGSDYYNMVEEAVALDDLTVQYTLNAPTANFITNAGYWVDVMPEHLFKDIEDLSTADIPTVGFGPYKLVDYVDGEYYYFERVENWPLANDGVGGYAETITFMVYTDVNAAVLALESGEIDCISTSLSQAAQEELEGNENFGMEKVWSLGYGYVSFNYKNPMLADQTVRKAIAMTMDRDSLVNIALGGAAMAMNTPISPVYANLTEGAATYPAFDLEGAKALLDEAGYVDSNGDGIREWSDGNPLAFTLTCRNSTANIDSIANIIKSNMEAVGIGLTVSIVDPATYTDNVTQNMTFDMNYIEWGVIDDPDMALDAIYLSSATLNFMGYKNDAIDAILLEVKTINDPEVRKEKMFEFQELFVEELASINLLVREQGYGYSTEKWEGWDAQPGLYGVADCSNIVKVHLKK